ncbi:uncharacterized oxidoreductase At1g06690, chloroplastic isoform X3 [Cucumis sativus]|uniref:uncharacterized oxidoreductase At1g06690, chloroplastic isoform X3 n=1 Tax=Cucumis sativus TaxID=3659 RepID=UPI0012F4E26A|nr:uncharacterized oxidoreductase At1g06690, chloroplastic isoform X3 [Cucumis sativus]
MASAFHYYSCCCCFFSINGGKGNNRVSPVRPRAVAPNFEEEKVIKLGGSEVKVSRLGIGAWSWGDNIYWNNNSFDWDVHVRLNKFRNSSRKVLFETLREYLKNNFKRVDCSITAHCIRLRLQYQFIKERKRKDPGFEITIATKYAVFPWRLGRHSVVSVLKESLCRLGLESVDLYQLHWPGIWGNEEYIDGLGDAVEQGLVKGVGVSNYNEKRLRDAYEKLKKRGIPLASNQVNYSLIYRLPEENGVKAACDELGVTLIAYAPLAQGVLTGKYTPTNPPIGLRSLVYSSEFLAKVVLNWLIAQGNVVPIPGAKNEEQAIEFVGALGWRISNEEIHELRSFASKLQPLFGLPFERL